MDVHELLRDVEERARTGDEHEAERLVNATLASVAEHLTDGEAADLAAQLPPPVQPALASGAGERFDYDELVRRVMVRADLEPDRAGMQVSAVLGVVRDAVSRGEWHDVASQLPGEDPVSATAGRAPSDAMVEDLRDELRRRPRGERWRTLLDRTEWVRHSDDGLKRAFLRVTAGDLEARVYRRPTGPSGPRVQLAHGPQVFADAAEAVDYAEAQLADDGAGNPA